MSTCSVKDCNVKDTDPQPLIDYDGFELCSRHASKAIAEASRRESLAQFELIALKNKVEQMQKVISSSTGRYLTEKEFILIMNPVLDHQT